MIQKLAVPLLAVAAAVTTVLAPSTSAVASPAALPAPRVVSADVSFEVVNSNQTAVACRADGRSYTLRGRLVGPRNQVLHGGIDRVDVLVHGVATGSWLWSLPGHAGSDYARALARRGETVLVLDRLGYGRSRIGDPRATCLGAQAQVLHQVVQELRAGKYTFTGSPSRATNNVPHVVVHGHSVGAAIAEIEAGTYRDVDGLVVMSWADDLPSRRVLDVASRQHRACLSAPRATFGGSDREFRSLLFASASAGVQRAATSRRVAAPCGDVTSLTQASLAARLAVRDVDVPVLLLHGSRDALVSDEAADAQRGVYGPRARVTSYDVPGAGSALPLEAAAPAVRRHVLAWLRTL